MNDSVTQGSKIQFRDTSSEYIIISIQPDYISLCRTNISKLDIIKVSKADFMDLYEENAFVIKEKDTAKIIDFSTLSEDAYARYVIKKRVFSEIFAMYGPDYIGLSGKEKKPELYKILEKYNLSKPTFWRICVKYFQSGFDENTLIDGRAVVGKKRGNYHYTVKTGKPCMYYDCTGIIVDDEIKSYFDEAIKNYMSGRHKSLKSAYNRMNNIHFTRVEVVNGISTYVLLPANERPTFKQFEYYASKKISKDEKDVIKTSQMEYRNNQRLLNSDSLFGVAGPGDMVEIDACEADVSLVSSINKNKCVGRPIVYFMIDVYSRIILAVSVAFDNNSLLGVTSLLLNLADNKKEYCERYGLGFDDDRLWPSNIIPNRIRVDRGSEFKSKEFDRICLALGIERDNVTGGSGSLKGVIEQSFHQMHVNQNVRLEDRGLIEKRYDSKHHEEATLTIDEFTKIIINFVLTHNQKYLETYPVTRDMVEKGIKAIPAVLWEYGVENFMTPRPIQNYEQYYYDLMTPIKAKVSRKGIEYKNLIYNCNDPYLTRRRIKAGNKKLPFEARMDMRDVGAVYYISNGQLVKATLNEDMNGNADYKYLTMKQWEDYDHEIKRLKTEGNLYNQQLSAFSYHVNEGVVSEATRNAPKVQTDKKDMREEREIEKQRVSKENRIDKRLSIPEKLEEKKPTPASESKLISRPWEMTQEQLRQMRWQAVQDFNDEE